MSESRIAALEERIAFQDDLLQKLDEALSDQQRQLLVLRDALRVMTERVQTLEAGNENIEDGRPPHY